MWNDLMDHLSEITPTAWEVYCILNRYADHDSRAHPSEARIGDLMGVSPRTVRRGLLTLLRAGWITIHGEDGSHNVYHLHPPTTPDKSVREDQIDRTNLSGDPGHICPGESACQYSGKRLKKKTTKRGNPLPPFKFPPALDTPEVRQAVQEWLAHRKRIKKPIKHPAEAFEGWFEDYPTPTDFIAAVKFSRQNGYQGLFARKGQYGSRKTTDRPSSRF